MLERGGFIPREKDNWSSRANVMKNTHAPEKWLDSNGKEFQPGTHYYVGGNTKFYGAARCFVFRKQDFSELRHKGGISPAWPVSYDDFEPYYTEAEYLYQVHGERGSDPRSHGPANLTADPR